MADIISKIKNVRNKPEEAKKRILWILVFVCMIFVLGVWVFTFLQKGNDAGNRSGLDPKKYSGYDNFSKSFEDLEKEKNESIKNAAFELEKTETAAIVMKYIDQGEALKGLSSKDVILIKEEKKDGIWQLACKQTYKDVPVELSDIEFSVNAENKTVTIEKSVYFSGIDLDISPKISDIEALESIKSEIGDENITANKSQIVIYTVEDSKKNEDHHLSWKMNVYDNKSYFEGIYFVDANSGKILTK